MKDKPEFQLELWIPKGRKGGAWVQSDALPAGHDASLYARTWRKVLKGHKHRDKLPHSIARVRGGYAVDRATQCERYCEWARSKGLARVTVYADDWRGINAALKFALPVCEVDPEEFIGPMPEPDVYGGWDNDGHPSHECAI